MKRIIERLRDEAAGHLLAAEAACLDRVTGHEFGQGQAKNNIADMLEAKLRDSNVSYTLQGLQGWQWINVSTCVMVDEWSAAKEEFDRCIEFKSKHPAAMFYKEFRIVEIVETVKIEGIKKESHAQSKRLCRLCAVAEGGC
jgi:hypothetical protein